MSKPPSDLLTNPLPDESMSSSRTPPVSKAISYLAITDGKLLETLTRTNSKIVSAIDSGTVYVYRYRSNYVLSRIQQIERLAISSDGLGRSEMIEAVRAGGAMPDSFYQPDTGPADYDLGEINGSN